MEYFGMDLLVLAVVFTVASIPMGAFAYGFSSISTPLLLLAGYTNRQFAPLLNFIELWQNPLLLYVNRRSITAKALGQALPISLGIVPGTLVGALLLKSADPSLLRLATFLVLAPLVLAQAAGIRRPLGDWRLLAPLGFPIGVLYGVTTISGPPLAMILNNNGLVKGEFRTAMAVIRTVESTATFISYLTLGVFKPAVVYLAALVAPVIVASMIIGQVVARMARPEDFRRLTMSFDAWMIGYGLMGALGHWLPFALIVIADLILLRYYITVQRPRIIKGENSPI
ncbi:sulfite exporter TauE/SafE family protein [Pyrobaculum sp. 3827-6]|uniref:sulfite exporter TauE/SafE family protein n=1 Tax=Pyrobaculum sp. 3827-6 TaxID=2983604 RepID=UPI0021D9F9B7|nr:sulfite exporter TauE/SafE family protein [Pyrobaculum sp. 3827-6]MCU7787722.1 sulfite exporter TauE/SafE family protein [Pyrobaculum sp. 3827-6]